MVCRIEKKGKKWEQEEKKMVKRRGGSKKNISEKIKERKWKKVTGFIEKRRKRVRWKDET